MTSRLVVLISGNGSNLQAILDACASGDTRCQSRIRDQQQSGCLRTRPGKQMLVSKPSTFPNGKTNPVEEYDARLAACVSNYLPDYVILAGWMRFCPLTFFPVFRTV